MTNKIITTIEQDREMVREDAKSIYFGKDADGQPNYMTDSMIDWWLDKISSLSIEHVLESLKEEVEARKYTFEKVDWGDGITSDEPVERKDVSLTEAKGHNLALSSVSTLIGEVIKHVKK